MTIRSTMGTNTARLTLTVPVEGFTSLNPVTFTGTTDQAGPVSVYDGPGGPLLGTITVSGGAFSGPITVGIGGSHNFVLTCGAAFPVTVLGTTAGTTALFAAAAIETLTEAEALTTSIKMLAPSGANKVVASLTMPAAITLPLTGNVGTTGLGTVTRTNVGLLTAATASSTGTETLSNAQTDWVEYPASWTPNRKSAGVATIPVYDHVLIVLMENRGYSTIVGSTTGAPYINNTLIAGGTLMTSYQAVLHPSQPNYFALYAGDNYGVLDDNPISLGSHNTLYSLLNATGKTFRGYGESGFIERKHSPWESFTEGTSVEDVWSNFNSTAPAHTVSWISPAPLNNMHDGTVTQGDTWLQNNINAYAQWAKTHNSLLIVVWDEDENTNLTGPSPVACIFYGAQVNAGVQNATATTHYSLLKMLCQMYSLTPPANAATAADLNIWGTAVGLIGQATLVGSTPIQGTFNDASWTTTWSNGTPVATGSNTFGIYCGGTGFVAGRGISFSMPADLSQRSFRLIWQNHSCTPRVVAHLSDGSATDVTYNGTGATSGTNVPLLTTGTYRASGPGQTLTLTMTAQSDSGDTSGNIAMQCVSMTIGNSLTVGLTGNSAITRIGNVAATGSSSALSGTPFYGLNDHSGYPPNNYTTIAAQYSNIGIKVARYNAGHHTDVDFLAGTIWPALTAQGVELYPMIEAWPGDAEAAQPPSETNAYNWGFDLGAYAANKLAGVRAVELFNEAELNAGSGTLGGGSTIAGDGAFVTDYGNANFQIIRGSIRGMYDGWKSVDTLNRTKIVIGAGGWLHFGFTQGLWDGTQPDGTGGHPTVRGDWMCWHWYRDMGDITNATGGTGTYNVLNTLKTRFGLPLVITECGDQVSADSETTVQSWVNTFLGQMVSNSTTYNILSAMWYMRTDAASDPQTIGLYTNNGVTEKPRVATMRNFISANPMAYTPQQKLFYGINIHTSFPVYSTTLGTAGTVNLLKDLGMTVARMDFYNTSDAATAATWCQAFQAAGMVGLPILIATRVDGDQTTSYNNGFALGQAIANSCKNYTNYYEMGNEIDDQITPRYTTDGLVPSCYSLAGWQGARGVLLGVYDGVKSVQPGATLIMAGQTVLTKGFTIGMFNGTDPDGTTGHTQVKCDAMAWHWYESSGDITNTGSSGQPGPCGSPTGGLNMLSFCNGYAKPQGTWLTEIGNTDGDTQAQQSTYVTTVMTQHYNNRAKYNITNVSWYELVRVTGNGASTYGLVEADGVTKRTAYTTMKNFIAAHPV